MWQYHPTTRWQKDREYYERKHPRELAALMNNLGRYVLQLKSCKNAKCVQAGYLHTEGKGVLALDQKGGGVGLQEARMYIYAHEQQKVLYLITIGDKNTQSDDIQASHTFVQGLLSKPDHPAE